MFDRGEVENREWGETKVGERYDTSLARVRGEIGKRSKKQ